MNSYLNRLNPLTKYPCKLLIVSLSHSHSICVNEPYSHYWQNGLVYGALFRICSLFRTWTLVFLFVCISSVQFSVSADTVGKKAQTVIVVQFYIGNARFVQLRIFVGRIFTTIPQNETQFLETVFNLSSRVTSYCGTCDVTFS